MAGEVTIVYDQSLAAYDFGPTHPLSPVRVQLAYRLAEEFGLLAHERARVVRDAPVATEEELLRVHTPEFLDAVRRAGRGEAPDARYGLGTMDVPAFDGMHEAAAHVAGATLTAARAVREGRTLHAVNLAGGLHHAHAAAASGFCVYNDIAVAIADLLDSGVQRVAYVDVDVHHGDGVQSIFYDDPRVLTVSIHQSGKSLFPGTGYPYESGGAGAEGTAVNIALPAGTGDDAWLRAFHSVVPDVLEAFGPEILVTQHGCDSHALDPLAGLDLSIDGQARSYAALHRMAHRYTDGRWIAVGGGGYEWVEVVPRAWTHLLAIALGSPIAGETAVPDGFTDYVTRAHSVRSAPTMGDGASPWARPWETGYDPDDPVDRAVIAARAAVYPHLGILDDDAHFHF